ncbi:MAG: 2Fe-2S iron-sulfur cluster-binding protein [Steroidobacteraceae bacterium]
MRIRLSGSELSFSAASGHSLLDAALDASLNLPHSCKGGNCGSCRARLLQGEIDYPNGRPLGLSDDEIAEGYVLLCQARPRGDLSIEIPKVGTPDQILTKRLPARIERVLPLAHDVLGLHLRLPAAEAFEFQAGQYIDVMLPGGRRRSFSIASPPHDSRLLELHVRRVEGGEFSAPLFDDERRGTLLTIEGPLGQFVYRDGGLPMLLVGGGTGLAPLLSMLRHVVENGIERDLRLYWGVRAERDLYALAALEDLARRAGAGRLRYVPVLSEPSPEWQGRRGFVHQAALEDVDRLEEYEVYAAGPPAMIEAVRRDFGRRGAAPARLYFDSFDYAPDTLDRQRMSAATKS